MRAQDILIGFGLGAGALALGMALLSWKTENSDPITRYTFGLMLFTAVLAVVGIIQIAFLYKADQTAATTAEAAKQSADIAKESLVRVQRAFVFVSGFEEHVVGNESWIAPIWINSGSTPANPCRNWVTWKTFHGEPPDTYAYPDLDMDGNPVLGLQLSLPFFLGPKATSYAEVSKVPLTIMEQVRDGHSRLFIWGWAEYSDVFDSALIHRTEFCYEVRVTNLGLENGKTKVAIQMVRYGSHNVAN